MIIQKRLADYHSNNNAEAIPESQETCNPYYLMSLKKVNRDHVQVGVQKIRDTGPDDVCVHLGMGDTLQGWRNDIEGDNHYEAATRLAPGLLEAYSCHAPFMKSRCDDRARAMDRYRKAIELDPDDDLSHKRLGIMLAEDKRWPEAKMHLEMFYCLSQGVEFGDPAPIMTMMGIYTDKGDYGSAREMIETLLNCDPDDAELCHAYGTLLSDKLGDKNASVSWFEKAVTTCPDVMLYHRDLATALMESGGDHLQAMLHLDKALELDPEDVDTIMLCAKVCTEDGRTDEALFHLGKIVAKQDRPGRVRTDNALARGRYDLDKARLLYENMIEQDPANREAHCQLALMLDHVYGEHAKARGHYEALLGLDWENMQTREMYQEFMSRHQFGEAAENDRRDDK